MNAKRLHFCFAFQVRDRNLKPETWKLFVVPISHVDKVPGDRGRRGHRRTDQMRATAAALPAFKVSIAGRSAAFTGLQNVWIHAETHRATRLAPLKSSV